VTAPTGLLGLAPAAERSPSLQRSRDRSLAQAGQLVSAARRLAQEKGDQFTTADLVKEAGVALKTFYRYFESKDMLLLAVFESIVLEGAARYAEEARPLPDALSRLRLYVESALRHLDGTQADDVAVGGVFVNSQRWRLQRLFPAEIRQAAQAYHDLLVEALTEGMAEGTVAVDDVPETAAMIERLVRVTFHDVSFAKSVTEVDVPAVIEQVWQFCYRSIRAPG
jgi:TetR/AcrR family transcriptional regulator